MLANVLGTDNHISKKILKEKENKIYSILIERFVSEATIW